MHLQGFAHVWSKGGFRQKNRLATTHEKTISCVYSFFMELQRFASKQRLHCQKVRSLRMSYVNLMGKKIFQTLKSHFFKPLLVKMGTHL